MESLYVNSKIGRIEIGTDSGWSFENYLNIVQELIKNTGAKEVIEIGGGRRPSFNHSKVEELGINYTSNDIVQRELDLSPNWVLKACFDVQSPDPSVVAPFAGKYDLAYSRMVMEHVASYERAYRNIYSILTPGGVSIAHHPLLQTIPFVINKIVPEATAGRILRALFPNRTDAGTPKFPAHYDGCIISKRVRNKLKEVGFSQVIQIPFFGHGYYDNMPVVRDIQRNLARFAANRKLTKLAAYAYTIVIK